MAAFNVVRFRVKPGNEQRFIEFHRTMRDPKLKGFLGGALIKTGDQTFCMVGQWRGFQNIVDARPQMTGLLDSVRDLLDDMGSGLGVTDPVSGEVVAKFGVAKAAKKRRAKKRAVRKVRRAKKRAVRKVRRAKKRAVRKVRRAIKRAVRRKR